MSRIIETTQYLRKPLYVAAVKVTGANFDEVASWCQGDIETDEVPGHGDRKFIRVRVHNPKSPRQTKAFVGDWLLYTERGYKVYTNKAFHAAFDVADNETPSYPHDDDDMTVIGPECFVQKDGSVLCWKGVNYTPQTTHEDVYMGSEEIMPGVTVNQAVETLRRNEDLVGANGQAR